MTDNIIPYLCKQLQAALDDAPGGEKAWVPLRRSLAQSCLEQLQAAAAAHDLLCELRVVLDRVVPREALADEALRPRIESIEVDIWGSFTRQQRIYAIREAMETGQRPDWMPDKRTWRRHYPEAFATNGKEHAHAE